MAGGCTGGFKGGATGSGDNSSRMLDKTFSSSHGSSVSRLLDDGVAKGGWMNEVDGMDGEDRIWVAELGV